MATSVAMITAPKGGCGACISNASPPQHATTRPAVSDMQRLQRPSLAASQASSALMDMA